MPGVFDNIKVADFTWNAVGPITTRYLAHQGATVIKVESATRPDDSRFVPPYKNGVVGVNRSSFWTDFNTNKYEMSLNLNHPRSKEVVLKLIQWADIVAESYSAGTVARWGLSYEELKKIKPDIIMFSTTMQGQYGPYSSLPGFGFNLLSLSGFSHLLGYPNSSPLEVHGAYTDWIAPRFGAVALIAALDYRRRTGEGQYLDLSQLESSVHFLTPALLDYSVNGHIMQRQGNRSSSSAPRGAYRCRGADRWCVIEVTTEQEWESFREVVGFPEWTNDPRFDDLSGRKNFEDELDRLVEEWTLGHSPEEVMALMQQAGVPAGVVATGEDLLNDPQLKHRRHFVQLEHPEIGLHSCQGVSFKLSRTPSQIVRSAPCLGQDTSYICSEILGIGDDQLVELIDEGVFE